MRIPLPRQLRFAAHIASVLILPLAALCDAVEPLKSYKPDGKPSTSKNVTAEKQRAVAWITSPQEKELHLQPRSGKWPETPNGELFVEMTYMDATYGRIKAVMKTKDGLSIKPDKYTQVVMMASKTWKTAFFRFPQAQQDEIESVVISVEPSRWKQDRESTKEPAIAVSKATASSEAPKNGYFRYLLAESWKGPYTGPTVPPRDNTTLRGKTMTGYQGWFRTPNDPYDAGWVHWGDVPGARFSVDMWPYLKDYPEHILEKAHDVKYTNGKQAYLFSSARPEAVITHFKWMQKYDIDGAFLQRFINGGSYATSKNKPEWVLGAVREAANRTGRIWAIEYDVSGCRDDTLFERISTDWKWLIDEFKLRDDPNYARVDGKPVVYVWGMELRGLALEEANKVVDFLKNDPKYGGNYFIGGASGAWRNKPEWIETHFKKHDAVGFWMSKDYARDLKDVREKLGENVGYFAHIMPGFSWYNLKHYQSAANEAYTPRRGGEFVREQIEKVRQSGADMVFIGMFDEYDECTAFMPMADHAPKTPERPGVMVFFSKAENKNPEHTPPQELRQSVALDFGAPPKPGFEKGNYVSSWNGSIKIPKDGEYTFSIDGPKGDSFTLKSSNKNLISENGINPDLPPREVRLKLKKGDYFPFRLIYTHREEPGKMTMMWEGPNIKRSPIPEDAYIDAWGRFIDNEGQDPFLYLELCKEVREIINPDSQQQKKKR